MYLSDSGIASLLLATSPRKHNKDTLFALEQVIRNGDRGTDAEWVRECTLLFDEGLVVEHDGKVFVNRDLSPARIVGLLNKNVRQAAQRSDSLVLFKSTQAFGVTRHGTRWDPHGETSIPESGVDSDNHTGTPTRKGDGLCASSDPMEAVRWGTPENLMALEVQKADILGSTRTKYRFTKAVSLGVLDFHDTFHIMSQLRKVSGWFFMAHFVRTHYNSPRFLNSSFGQCYFTQVTFERGMQDKVMFEDCCFASCTWDMTKFKRATFLGCEFVGPQLRDCDFSECVFMDCDFNTMHGQDTDLRQYLKGAGVYDCRINGIDI